MASLNGDGVYMLRSSSEAGKQVNNQLVIEGHTYYQFMLITINFRVSLKFDYNCSYCLMAFAC